MRFFYMHCDVAKLKGDNYKVLNERILFHLGWLDIDLATRKDESYAIIEIFNLDEVYFYEKWE